jgi:hypothetical protein
MKGKNNLNDAKAKEDFSVLKSFKENKAVWCE